MENIQKYFQQCRQLAHTAAEKGNSVVQQNSGAIKKQA